MAEAHPQQPRPFARAQALENAAFLAELRRTGNVREAAPDLAQVIDWSKASGKPAHDPDRPATNGHWCDPNSPRPCNLRASAQQSLPVTIGTGSLANSATAFRI